MPAQPSTLLTQFLPNADASSPDFQDLDFQGPDFQGPDFQGEVHVNIHASASAIYEALHQVTLDDMPLAKWLGNLRYLPSILTGKSKAAPAVAVKPFLQILLTEANNILLAEEKDQEIVIGAIGQFHNIVDQQIVPLHSVQEFIEFDDPRYQKLVMSFRLQPLVDLDGYRLTLTHVTHALSPSAQRNFARYWLAIKPGGNFVSWLLLRAIKTRAEKGAERNAAHRPVKMPEKATVADAL